MAWGCYFVPEENLARHILRLFRHLWVNGGQRQMQVNTEDRAVGMIDMGKSVQHTDRGRQVFTFSSLV